MTLPILEGYELAVNKGTRTRTGAPGPHYWQQWADYKLEAELNPVAKRMTGKGTISYQNRSPDTLRTVYVQLLQNIFAPGARHNTGVPWSVEGIELDRVAAQGTALAAGGGEGPGYDVNGTIMRIRLPKPLPPGGTADFALDWRLRVPPDGAPRGGQDGEVYFMNYWYPQMAVYDDVNGWQIDQYLGNAEFYMGYGELRREPHRAGRLAGRPPRGRCRTRRTCSPSRRAPGSTRPGAPAGVVHVVTDVDREPGRSTTAGKDGKLTWRFRAQNVRDVAWAASRSLPLGRHQRAVGDADGDGKPDTALIQSFYRPEQRINHWDQSARDAQYSIEFFSKYLWPYPVSAHDRGGRPRVVRGHGVPDDDLHRRPVGHARDCTRSRPTRSATCGFR